MRTLRICLFSLSYSYCVAATQSVPLSDPLQTQALNSAEKMFTTQVSAGYGNSFGGFGLFIQGNLSTSFSMHAGAGYFPLSAEHSNAKDMIMVSGGVKAYLTRAEASTRFFLDVQFGMLGGAYREIIRTDGVTLLREEEQKAIYGPSILFGGETVFSKGRFGLIFAGGISYNIANIEWKHVGLLGALDLGLLFRF